MAKCNGFSDSQESNFLDDETYESIIQEIGVSNIDPLNDFEVEEKYAVSMSISDIQPSLGQHYQGQYQHHYQQPEQSEQGASPPFVPGNTNNEDFPGNFKFEFTLADNNSSKYWVYSSVLQKIYIQMEQTLPIFFKWKPACDGLWIRATLMYNLPHQRSDPVTRCHNHVAGSKENTPYLHHVLRCKHANAIYEDHGGHNSVRIPLGTPSLGIDYVQMYFMFHCKNSCPTGMNRRPTEVIFTLEDGQGMTLGRRKLLVSICSCPKRDKEKAERQVSDTVQPTKKRKYNVAMLKKPTQLHSSEIPDLTPYKMCFTMYGKENSERLKKAAYDIMSGYAVEMNLLDTLKPCLDEIRRTL